MENTKVLNVLKDNVMKNALTHITYTNDVKNVTIDGVEYRVHKDYKGRVTKITNATFHLGCVYENMAQNKNRDFSFEPIQKANGMHEYMTDDDDFSRYVLQNDKDMSKLYLRIPQSKATSSSSEYFLDNEKIDIRSLLNSGVLVEVKHRDGYVKPTTENYYKVIAFENIIDIRQNGVVVA